MIARYHAGQLETYSLKDDKDPVLIHEMIVDTDNSLLISTERGLVRWSNGQLRRLECEMDFRANRFIPRSKMTMVRCGFMRDVDYYK